MPGTSNDTRSSIKSRIILTGHGNVKAEQRWFVQVSVRVRMFTLKCSTDYSNTDSCEELFKNAACLKICFKFWPAAGSALSESDTEDLLQLMSSLLHLKQEPHYCI